MKFTLLKSLIIRNENPSVFALKNRQISSSAFLKAEDALFGNGVPPDLASFFASFLAILKEKTPTLTSQECFLLRKILFISYLESVGLANLPSFLKGYEQDADLILEETPSLKAKRIKDMPNMDPREMIRPFLEAKDNVAFANVLFDVPLEWTPLSKIFFATPLCFLEEPKDIEETILQNEFDYLAIRSDECAKQKHDYLLGLTKSASSNAERDYYFDLLKRHWTFAEDFLLYPVSARKAVALLNPFYWLNMQDSIKDSAGNVYKIDKPKETFSPLKGELTFKDLYSIKQEKDGVSFVYYPKTIGKTAIDSINEQTKKEAQFFIFGLPE